MKVYSVTINLFVSLVLTVALSSCAFSKRSLDGVFTPDCKQFGIGSICFQNTSSESVEVEMKDVKMEVLAFTTLCICLLYTSPSPRDATLSRMPSSA